MELFNTDDLDLAKQEWKGMPEFVQGKQSPYSAIIVRFECKEDLDGFTKLIGQKLTYRTKSIWFPFKSHWGNNKESYGDEP
jgi:hypothetical protein